MSKYTSPDVLEFAQAHGTMVRTALTSYISNMTEIAGQTQAGYDAIKDDPAAREAQDKTMITTNGLKHSAALFRESADRARKALEAFNELTGEEW